MKIHSSVAIIACAAGHYSGQNPTWLTYAAVPILRCLNTDTEVVTLTFDLLNPKNGFPAIIVKHLYVKFGDPSCVDFWEKKKNKKKTEKQTDRQRPVETLPMRLASSWEMKVGDLLDSLAGCCCCCWADWCGWGCCDGDDNSEVSWSTLGNEPWGWCTGSLSDLFIIIIIIIIIITRMTLIEVAPTT